MPEANGQAAPAESSPEAGGQAPAAEDNPYKISADNGASGEADPEVAAREAFYEGHEDENPEADASHLEGEGDGAEGDQTEEGAGDGEGDGGEEITEINVKKWEGDLAKTTIPHKFRDQVKTVVDSAISEAKEQHSKLTEGYAESNTALAKALVNVIRSDDPIATLNEYAQEFIPALGLPKELLQNLEKRVKPNAGAEGGQEQSAIDSKAAVATVQTWLATETKKVEDYYWPLLENETNPQRARQLFSEMDHHKRSLDATAQMEMTKASLISFYQKIIKPKFDKYGQLEDRAAQNDASAARAVKVSHWNRADDALTTKYKAEWKKYRPEVKKILKSDYAAMMNDANDKGKGHQRILEDIFLRVSRGSHIQQAKQNQQLGKPGLRPQGRGQGTTKNVADMTDKEAHDYIKQSYWGS